MFFQKPFEINMTTDQNGQKVRIGIIGLGRVATATHLPVLKQIKDATVTACAEKNESRVRRVREIMDIPHVFGDHRELIESGTVDAVYICTPPHVHYEAAMSALHKGIHVLCEKPMGRTLEEAEAMSSLAKMNDLVLMPGFKYRYSPHLQQARQIIESGVLGSLLQVDATFMTPGPYISWDPKSDWYLEEEQGGVVYDIGVHIIELLNFLSPGRITRIHAQASQGYCEYRTPTNVSCSFTMEQGVTGTVLFGWRSSADLTRISLYGTGGAVVVGLKSFDYYNAGTDPKDRVMNHLRNSMTELGTVMKRILAIARGSEVSVNDLAQATAFIGAVQHRSMPPVTGENAVSVHRVLKGIQESIRTAAPVDL